MSCDKGKAIGLRVRLGEKVRQPGIEPGTLRYLRHLQSHALPAELLAVALSPVLPCLSTAGCTQVNCIFTATHLIRA